MNNNHIAESTAESPHSSYLPTLIILTSLFFMWGFITCLNDILIPHLKNVFSLNYAQAMLIQFCFFGAYFTVSLPAGSLIKRVGYKHGIVIGLGIAATGCLLFYPAAGYRIYAVFLLSLFILASGITVLQVAANPYVTILGNPESAPARLTLTQAFNSLGTTVAPFFGSVLIFSALADRVKPGAGALAQELEVFRAAEAAVVQTPYLILAATLFVLALFFVFLNLPSSKVHSTGAESHDQDLSGAGHVPSAWSFPSLKLGAVAIFVYVGAEVSIGSFLVNYLSEPSIAAMDKATAANYVAYYWGGAMVGRFLGFIVMRAIKPGTLLAFNAAGSVLLLVCTMAFTGKAAMWSILLVGLCNSIMFPTIFSLAVHGLGMSTSQGSGILCLAIVGGAVLPVIQGVLADTIGIQHAFILPLVCYLYIIYYGLAGSELRPQLEGT